MQTPGTGGQPYISPIKQFGRQQQDNHSGSSPDQLGAPGLTPSAQYERCPLIPCMPDLTKGGASLRSQQPMSELAGLHAALSNEGVQFLRSPTQQQPPQQPWQQQYQQPHQHAQQQQAQSPLRSGLQQHRHSITKQQSRQADDVLVRASHTSVKLGQVGDELFVISSRLQDMGRSKAQQNLSAALLSELDAGIGSPSVRMDAVDAWASCDAKCDQPEEVVHRLREELTNCNEMVLQRARRSCSPDKPGMHRQGHSSSSGSASISSKESSAHLPQQQQQPQAGPAPATQQQQQQELLGLAGSSSKASAAATALVRRIANSEALRRLQHLQQQPASKQAVVQLGLQQVQDLTELSQMLLPGLQAQHAAVAECQQKVGAISSVLQKHPQLANPAAIQSIMEKNRKLEGMLEALRRENQAKDLAHMNTLSVLRENTATPRDRRLALLQHENLALHQKLMSRDAQMQRLQDMLAGTPQQQQQQQGVQQQSSGELSPVAADGQRYDEAPAARQVHRSLWGPLNGQGYPGDGQSSGGGSSRGTGSCTAGSSRSCTPSSRTDSASLGAAVGLQLQPGYQQQQQRDLSPGKVSSITAQFERQLAAGRTAVPQMQQQLDALRSPNTQPGIFSESASLIRQPGEQFSQPHNQSMVQPTSGAGAGPPLDNLKAQVQQQWSALDQQQQQFAGMRASLEASHKRQLETERRQRETTQQQCELWKGKTEELVRQLTDARAQVAALQQQQTLSDRRSSGSASASGSSGGGAAGDRQQQRQRLLQESVVRELQGQLSQARQEKADLQAQLDQATSENAVHKAEIKKQVNRLQLAEQALLDYQALKDQAQQLRQHSQDLQQQLARVQEAAAAAEGTTQECRKQLAAADCEKAVLMDRIRQLANRASLAESQAHRSRSGGDSSADAIQDRSPEEHGSSSALTHTSQRQQQVLHFELPAACAELNQQVLVLRGQLAEAQGKEERLQVTNASLQERLSRLQAEDAARDASASNSRQSSSSGSQQQQQKVEELLQQVADLQQKLAAATTAHAAASAAVAVAGSNRLQQQAGDTQQEQQAQADAMQEQVQQLQAALEDQTLELQEWQIHADALEKDLEDLKAQVLAAEGLQGALEGTQAQLAAARSQQQQLQQDLEQARGNMSQLEYELHGLGQERTALRSRVDVLTAELTAAREGSADLRLRLDHFTGPGGPQARVKQLEAALQLAHRKLEAAEARAGTASSRVSELTQQLGGAEDQIVALEGHISVLEEQLAAYTQLPQ